MKRRRRIAATPMVQITSMLDMFTILLVFLLNFLDPSRPPDEDALRLPPSSASVTVAPGPTLVVTPDGVRVAGRLITALAPGPSLPSEDGRALEEVQRALEAIRPQDGAAEVTLVVQVDRSVTYGIVASLLATARAAGFDGFRFVVLHEAG